MCLYEVCGDKAYYDNPPGSRFESRQGRGVDARAVARGAIRLIRVITPELQPGSYRLPDGWLSKQGKE